MTASENILDLKDVTIMAVTANFGIRWLPVAAGLGASASFFWLLGALFFFAPLVVIAIQLSALHPDEGGMYSWTKKALGEQAGFMVAWLYWVNTLFFYPAILIFLATNFAYFLGKPELTHNHYYISFSVLSAFWLVTFISFYGLKANKYLVDIGGIIGSFIPAIAIILLGFTAYFISGHSATVFSLHAMLPHGSIFHNLSTLTMIMFAMAGIEIIPTFANSIKNAQKTLFTGLTLAAFILFALYILGTIALNLVASPNHIDNAAGLMQAFDIIAQELHMPWFTKVISFMLTFAEFAAVSIWLLAPIIMFFKCTRRGILPDWFHQTNRYNAPHHALLFMAILVSIIVLLSNFLATVNAMYNALILMATVLYFIPYLYLVVAYIKLHHSKRRYLYGSLVFISITLGILFSFEPPTSLTHTHDILIYEAELILGPMIFFIMGWLIYKVKTPKKKSSTQTP